MQNFELKTIVKDKYSEIASQGTDCSSGCCCGNDDFDYSIMSESYTHLDGYNQDADLSLGCGIPTEFAGIEPGNIVVDLGSGAGNDVFVARALVGATGKVIGIDFTDEMLAKANLNLQKSGFENVEFIKGDIEDIPLSSEFANVVVSNCVLNLVPDKSKAFEEIFRILKTGGHFCVSDIVVKGTLPDKLKNAAAAYTGCVAGAVDYEVYLDIINRAGFVGTEVLKEKVISIPDSILMNFINEDELKEFKQSSVSILSITVKSFKRENKHNEQYQ